MKLNRAPRPEDIQMDTSDWNAEILSRHPDHHFWISNLSSSWDCLAMIYILSHFGDFYWMTDTLYRKMSERAYVANYEGEWSIVQNFLEQYPQTPQQFYDLWLLYKSPEEFFGNLKKRAKRLSYGCHLKPNNPQGRRVRKPQRVRGYRDKGTLRLPHQYHGDPPVPEAQKLDFRGRCGHPLLREKEDFPGEDKSQ